jgi:hypothetical protein
VKIAAIEILQVAGIEASREDGEILHVQAANA